MSVFTIDDVLSEVHKEFPQIDWFNVSYIPVVSLAMSPEFIIKEYSGFTIGIVVYCKGVVVGLTHSRMDDNEENRLLLGSVLDRLSYWLNVYKAMGI